MNTSHVSLSVAEALVRSYTAALGHNCSSKTGDRTQSRSSFTVTISREAGALGKSVAAEVGDRLGWPVYHREALEQIAEDLDRPPSCIPGIDEWVRFWLEESLCALADQFQVGSDTYLKYLLGVLRGLGAVGRCVILGRGANFVLPAETTLRVRLVARLEDRIGVIARRIGLSAQEAADWVAHIELQRFAYARHAFREDPTKPHHYDLVLNMSRLSVCDAAVAVTESLRRLERHGALAEQAEAPVGRATWPHRFPGQASAG